MKKLAFVLLNNWLRNLFAMLIVIILVVISAKLFPEVVFESVLIRSLALSLLAFGLFFIFALSLVVSFIGPTAVELIKHLDSKNEQSIKKLSRLTKSSPFKVLLTLHFINTATINMELFFGPPKD